jgi:hypothetical protein
VNAVEIVGLIGAVASIVGVVLFFALRSRPPRKLLSWEAFPAVGIASVLPHRADYKLSLLYERTGEAPVPLTGAFLSFVRLANLGDEPVRSADLTPNDPLRLVVFAAQVLDISLAAVTREVTNFQLGPFAQDRDQATTRITFDFLDAKDGALLRVLTSDRLVRFDVQGTVIGMPGGLRSGAGSSNSALSCGLMLLLLLLWTFAAIATVALIRRFIDWDPDLVWVPVAALAAFMAPFLLIVILGSLADRSHSWPERIRFPQWAEMAGTDAFRWYQRLRDGPGEGE